MLELNKIYNMDCLEGLKKIGDKTIDCIITDPPYFLGLTHNGKRACFNDLNIAEPFFKALFNEYKRVLKDKHSIYFFTDWRGYAFYYPVFDKILGAKNLLVWDKGSGAGNRYSYSHELAIFSANKNVGGLSVINDIKAFSGGAKRTNGEKVHPTQKPIELIEKFILDSTDEGAIILDTFSGSGTTAIAAKRTNRQFIGFEIDEDYYDISLKRLKE